MICLRRIAVAIGFASTLFWGMGIQRLSASYDKPVYEEFSRIEKNNMPVKKSLVLSNGMELYLIGRKDVETTAAAFYIPIGAHYDPKEILGLSHFTEHLVFEADRTDESLDEFLAIRNGKMNGFTSSDRSVYFLEIDQRNFEPALERFVEIISQPKFSTEYYEVEKGRVNDEARGYLENDSRRQNALYGHMHQSEHPAHWKYAGDAKTLSDDKVNLDIIKAHYEKHYASEGIKVVVVAKPEHLEGLEATLQSHLNKIKRKPTSLLEYPKEKFEPGFLPKKTYLKNLAQKETATIYFHLPKDQAAKDSRAAFFASHLLAQETDGSLISVLKKEGLVQNVLGNSTEMNGGPVLYLQIDFTRKGAEQKQRVYRIIDLYLKVLKSSDLSKADFKTKRAKFELDYLFRQGSSASNVAMLYARLLSEYRFEDFERSVSLVEDLDESIAQTSKLVQQISWENALVMESGQREADAALGGVVPNYQLGYEIDEFSLTPFASKEAREIATLFSLPLDNTLLPKSLSPMCEADISQELVLDQPGLKASFEYLHKYNTIQGKVGILIASSYCSLSPKTQTVCQIFQQALRTKINSYIEELSFAGIQVQMFASRPSNGLSIA